MKHLALLFLILTTITRIDTAFTEPSKALPAKKSAKKAARAPIQALPPKKAAIKTKRTYIDFSSVDTTTEKTYVDKSLEKSDREVRVQSRLIVPAPPGDSAEPMSSFSKTKVHPPVVAATPAPTVAATPAPNPMPIAQATPVPVATPLPVETPESAPQPELVAEPVTDESPQGAPEEKPDFKPVIETPAPTESVVVKAEVPTVAPASSEASSAPTMIFLRTGYLNANYRKFDDRMKNGATSMGLGAARGFTTGWGAFEARAALDAYHAVDQSITVDNLRMLTVRSELAYWLTHSRVKSGVSLGLGWSDYSIRSYRSIQGADEDVVVLRTHAKSRAFAVIPATSLRVELARELVVDAQTEFVGLLGGDSSDAAQGMGLTVALGWMF